jgi:hypothetical protein
MDLLDSVIDDMMAEGTVDGLSLAKSDTSARLLDMEPESIRTLVASKRAQRLTPDILSACRDQLDQRRAKKFQPVHFLDIHLMPGVYMLFAGNSGAAKSTIASQMALESAAQGKQVLLITNEMPSHDFVGSHMLNTLKSLTTQSVLDPADQDCIFENITMLDWHGDDAPTFEHYIPTMRQMHETALSEKGHGFDLIILDQLNNIRQGSANKMMTSAPEQLQVSKDLVSWLAHPSTYLPAIVLFQQLKFAKDKSEKGAPMKTMLQGATHTFDDCTLGVTVRRDKDNGDKRVFSIDKARFHDLVGGDTQPIYHKGAYFHPARLSSIDLELVNRAPSVAVTDALNSTLGEEATDAVESEG